MLSSAPPTPSITVVDSAVDPALVYPPGARRPVQYRSDGKRDHYKVWIYLAGDRVPFVEWVTYRLHHTFGEPVHRVARTPANSNCALVIWTWGVFEVHATIREKSGQTMEQTHLLSYDREFKQPGIVFVRDESSA
ncbi:MAG: hypothetical protein KIS62_02310 [Ramlibacter sp.]|nr:hypothetical protein [Ramlibacter sp.]